MAPIVFIVVPCWVLLGQPKSGSCPGEVPNKVANDVGRLEEKLPGREVVASMEDVSWYRE